MVDSSKRSPSPLPSRSNPNLPRSLETQQNQPTRKSFNGTNTSTRPPHLNNPKKFNFLTPAEIGRGKSAVDEEKENEKNERGQFLKSAVKLRSPSNGSKNFMAPTFAAASKFTPSPRKKTLVERNDPVRTSITLCNGKAAFFPSLSSDHISDFDRKLDDACIEEKNNEAADVLEVPIVPEPLKKVTFKEVTFNPSNLAQSFIEKGQNPKSDILSSPKIDVVKINYKGSDSDESKQLEDSCMCEFSENLSLSKFIEKSETGDSWERLEDISSVERIVSESLPVSAPIDDAITEGGVVSKRATKPHPLRNWKYTCLVIVFLSTFVLSAPNIPTMSSFVPKDLNFEVSELSEVAKIAKVKFSSLLLSAPNFPTISSFVSKDLNFELPELYEFAKIVKGNFNEVTGKVKQWSADSISYLYKIVLSVLEVDKMSPLQFMNFTILEDDSRISSLFDVTLEHKGFEINTGLELQEVEEEECENEMEEVDDAMEDDEQQIEEVKDEMEEVEQQMEEVHDAMKDEEQKIEEVEDEMEEVEDDMKEVETYSSLGSTFHMDSAPNAPDTESEVDTSEDDHISAEAEKSHEVNETGSSVESINQGNQESFSEMVSISESPDALLLKLDASEINHNSSATETEILFQQSQLCSSVESKKMVGIQESISDMDFEDGNSQIPKGPESSLKESRMQAQARILGTSLVLLCLGAVAVKIYLNQRSKKASTIVDTNPICNKKMNFVQQEESGADDLIGESLATEMSISQRSSSTYQNQRNTKGESVISESSAYEMSSSLRSSSSYQKKRNTKGESLVRSSENSFGIPSYGSFTTYETIPNKRADGDEEIVTPVRRSSRIRKQVTSQ